MHSRTRISSALTLLPIFAFLLATCSGEPADTAAANIDASLKSSCVLSSTECTCSEHTGSGVCTYPTGGGKCLDGECSDSMRCDCFGFELCAISTCGKWDFTPPAVRSVTNEFQCTYVADGSHCRTSTDFVGTVEGSTNARDAAVVFVDESIVDEREVGVCVSASLSYKEEALDMLRNLQAVSETKKEELTEEELAEVQAEADLTVVAVKEITVGKFRAICFVVTRNVEARARNKQLTTAPNTSSSFHIFSLPYKCCLCAALSEVSEQAAIAFQCEGHARAQYKTARASESTAVQLEDDETAAATAAADAGKSCATCEALKGQIANVHAERERAAKDSGTWARKARDARKKARQVRRRAQASQLSAEEARGRCGEKCNRILTRLGANLNP